MDEKDIEVLGEDSNYWWFRAKRELIESYIKPTDKVLNIGCGNHKPKHWVNYDDETWEKARNKYYDKVIMADVLEHIKNDELALLTALSKLKQGGKLIITVPAHQFLYNEHDKNLGHYKRYSIQDFQRMTFNMTFDEKIHNCDLKETIFYWNTWLFLPISLFKLKNKLFPCKTKSDFRKLPDWLNTILYNILSLDNNKKRCFFGLTLVVIYEKI